MILYVVHTLMSLSSAVLRQVGLLVHFLIQWRQLLARYSKLHNDSETNQNRRHKMNRPLVYLLQPLNNSKSVSCDITMAILVSLNKGATATLASLQIIFCYKPVICQARDKVWPNIATLVGQKKNIYQIYISLLTLIIEPNSRYSTLIFLGDQSKL